MSTKKKSKKNQKSNSQKDNIELYSEAYPPNSEGIRSKLYSSSSIHSELKDLKIKEEDIYYKPLSIEYKEEMKKLHLEWFPVRYDDRFFDDIFDPNYCGYYFSQAAFYKHNDKEILIGLVLCTWQFLEMHFCKYAPDEYVKKIKEQVTFKQQINSFLNCEDHHVCYIMTLGVLDEFRRLNIGSNLIFDVINFALYNPKCVCVYLHVIEYNNAAIKFYKKNLFEEVATINNFYDLNKQKYSSKVFCRILKKEEKYKYYDQHNFSLFELVKSNLLYILSLLFLIASFVYAYYKYFKK